MLKNKCAAIGLAGATAAGALFSGAPAYAQADLAQGWHHHRFRFYHRHASANLNRNRPRIFIRIYIYNRNNNVALAGQRQREQQREHQRQSLFDPGAVDAQQERIGAPGGNGAPGGVGAPGGISAPGTPAATPGSVLVPRAPRIATVRSSWTGRFERPTIVRDRSAVPQAQQPADSQAVSHNEPGVVRHNPANTSASPSGTGAQ